MRYCDPPSSVGEALRKFRDFLTKAQQTQGTHYQAHTTGI